MRELSFTRKNERENQEDGKAHIAIYSFRDSFELQQIYQKNLKI